jgi:hypothetical protein
MRAPDRQAGPHDVEGGSMLTKAMRMMASVTDVTGTVGIAVCG